MAYTDRLQELQYVSPSGQEFVLNFDGLTRTGGKKSPVSEFPGQDQGAVQDLGEQTIRFPITCYISGENYDLEADRFWRALSEPGYGRLNHPRWGGHDVIPSTREQRETFVDGAGRAVFTIEFIRADERRFTYPRVLDDTDYQIINQVDTAADQIESEMPEELDDPLTIVGVTASITGAVTQVTDTFDTLTGISNTARTSVNQAADFVTDNLSDLVEAPQQLMESVLQLYRTPAREIIDVQEKVEGYETIFTNLVNGFISSTLNYGEIFGLIAVANLNGIAIAAAESTTEGDIPTRAQAANIVETLTNLEQDMAEAVESIEANGDFSSGFESQAFTADAIAKSINNVIDRSLSLPTEKKTILEGDITPIVLAYELYGDLENLDLLIEYNDFTGNDILLIPAGTEVRWYEP